MSLSSIPRFLAARIKRFSALPSRVKRLATSVETTIRRRDLHREPAAANSLLLLLIPEGRPLIAGKMYLRLFHGRIEPNQQMEDWGFAGPTFGPLSCYVQTYRSSFRLYGEDDAQELWLERHDDLIRWNGCFYGDMEVFVAQGP